MAEQIMFF